MYYGDDLIPTTIMISDHIFNKPGLTIEELLD
jgi:hypothetical protein